MLYCAVRFTLSDITQLFENSMKTYLTLIVAYLCQMVSVLNATLIEVRLDPASPLSQSLSEGALVPILTVDVKASGKKFPPDVYLVVQVTGNSWWAGEQIVNSLYIGDPSYKLVSRGPFHLNGRGQAIVGPIFVEEDTVRPVLISALMADSITSFTNQVVRLEVVGAAVDGYNTELGDVVNITGDFPIRSPNFAVDTQVRVEKLSIRNVTQPTTISADSEEVTLGTLEVVAKNGDVKISDLPIEVVFRDQINGQTGISKIRIVDGNGTTIAQNGSPFFAEKRGAFVVIFRGDITVPEGTHQWHVRGVIDPNDLLEVNFLHIGVQNFGEVLGLKTGYFSLPSYEDNGPEITVLKGKQSPSQITAKITAFHLLESSAMPTSMKAVGMSGTIKPGTAYVVQASSDLKSWDTFGMVNKTDSIILKEVVGQIDTKDYPNQLFFRLVELP